MAGVRLQDVWKVFDGNVTAVKDFNLEIRDREFIVLVGPSGCGKSTTLRMVAGLEEVTRGTIKIGDRVVNDVPPKDRDIAMVFQNYALYPHMTVYDNMAFSLKLRHVPRREIRNRVEAASSVLGLTEFVHRKPKALSGGQRQRVALGRAIVREPVVFLFDEPLSNLDAKMRVEMRGELIRLHRRLNTTMIYVTHDQVEAMTLGERIVVMESGMIMQAAEPLTVYRYPANVFVARFIGTPPMNLFTGKLQGNGENFLFDAEAFKAALPTTMNGAIRRSAGRMVYLGIRPEDMELHVPSGSSLPGAFRAAVDMTETLGNEVIVHMKAGKHRFQVRTHPHGGLKLEGELEVLAHLDRAHVFNGETGRNLTAPEFAGATAHAEEMKAELLLADSETAP